MTSRRPSLTKTLGAAWPYAAVFLTANVLLSYMQLSRGFFLAVVFFGILLPFFLAWRSLRLPASPATAPQGSPPPWPWIFFGVLAVVLRFKDLTTLSAWPHYDEGVFSLFALDLLRGGEPAFLYGNSQWPPFYVRGLTGIFSLFGVSLGTLWAWPALLSLAAVPMAYLAARQFLNRGQAFFTGTFFAAGFWPLHVGRFGFGTAAVPFLTAAALYLLGRFLKAPTAKSREIWAAIVGAGIALGFYAAYLHWVAAAAAVGLTLLFSCRGSSKRPFLFFLAALFAGLLPFFLAVRPGTASDYLVHLLPAGKNSLAHQAGLAWDYLRLLFWGLDLRRYAYQPVWGGVLNPVFSTLFLLGLFAILKGRHGALGAWCLAAFPFFLLPGILSLDLDPFRLLPILAPLSLATVLGAWTLAGSFPVRFRGALLGVTLLAGLGLDAYHLFGPYQRVWEDPAHWLGYKKSILNHRAYSLLKDLSDQEGPGLVFPSFVPGISDATLKVACDPFNAAQNPALPFKDARWAAVVANVHFRPHLEDRFGIGRAYALGPDLGLPDGGWMLFVTDVTEGNRPVFERWREADRALGPFLLRSVGQVFGQDYAPTRAALRAAEPAFRGDPFLTACFWEKVADDLVKVPGEPGAPRRALERALAAVPAAHLYRNLGIQRWLAGDIAGARRAFREAGKAPFDLTDSKELSAQLGPQNP